MRQVYDRPAGRRCEGSPVRESQVTGASVVKKSGAETSRADRDRANSPCGRAPLAPRDGGSRHGAFPPHQSRGRPREVRHPRLSKVSKRKSRKNPFPVPAPHGSTESKCQLKKDKRATNMARFPGRRSPGLAGSSRGPRGVGARGRVGGFAPTSEMRKRPAVPKSGTNSDGPERGERTRRCQTDARPRAEKRARLCSLDHSLRTWCCFHASKNHSMLALTSRGERRKGGRPDESGVGYGSEAGS